MASEQIEYCGNCEHYEKCKSLDEKGHLHQCIMNKSKEN